MGESLGRATSFKRAYSTLFVGLRGCIRQLTKCDTLRVTGQTGAEIQSQAPLWLGRRLMDWRAPSKVELYTLVLAGRSLLSRSSYKLDLSRPSNLLTLNARAKRRSRVVAGNINRSEVAHTAGRIHGL